MPQNSDVRCAILAFHKIGEPPNGTWRTWNYVSTQTFKGFLEILADDGWQVIDLDTLIASIDDPSVLPTRSAVLTFDDGYQSMLTTAEPVLAEFGHPAVLFVPTDYVGCANQFDAGNEPEEPICTWDDLRELKRRRVAIESHSASHRSFDDLPFDLQVHEFTESKRVLEEHLEGPVHTFSFPFGARGNQSAQLDRALREAGYRAAFRYHGGVQKFPIADAFEVRRVPIGPDTDLRRQLGKEPK
jgi:peptidoglycan/xylan/chitin deacetylase (PgdA/CDA1 family)